MCFPFLAAILRICLPRTLFSRLSILFVIVSGIDKIFTTTPFSFCFELLRTPVRTESANSREVAGCAFWNESGRQTT